MTADRSELKALLEATAEQLIEEGRVNAVQSITSGNEDGLDYMEIQLLVPQSVFQDDDQLDEVYLAFQRLETGDVIITVNTHPDERN